MSIKTVSIIGLGALGILYGHHISTAAPSINLRIIADEDRINRYRREQVYCNNELCRFNYITPDQAGEPADLVIFTVKYNALASAIKLAEKQIGDNTLIISTLNGITSEAIIGETYGMEKVLLCVAQGMDAVKTGNRMTYQHMGILCIGDNEPGSISPKTRQVADFFAGASIPYEIDDNMWKRLWGKLMLNVGVNQTAAVYEGNYGTLQEEGSPRKTMIAAMKEVIALAPYEGVSLTDEDLNYWLQVLATLNPHGKPSMRQDLEAGRQSEVELFAGTILQLGRRHSLLTPINQALYDKIKLIESTF